MTLLTRAHLLGATDRRYHTFATPIGDARIRSLTEAEKSEFEGNIWSAKGDVNTASMKTQRRRLVALCLVDEQGNRLLTSDDSAALADIDGAITSQIFAECRKHCGFEVGEIEDLVKNSGEIADDDSASTSSTSSGYRSSTSISGDEP
jgi:hypothetical protein